VEEYLDYIEGINLGKISSDEFQNEIIKDWEVLVKKYIPINYKFDIVDLFCNYYERQCINNLIYSNLEYFWNDKIKNVMFVTGGRVYSYPNRILSIRIGIAKIYKQNYQKSNCENGEEIENLKEEKDDDESESE
jgi:centrosomal protein CEP76